jgi:hypothetical protein
MLSSVFLFLQYAYDNLTSGRRSKRPHVRNQSIAR